MNQRCREVSALELKSKVLIYTVNLITFGKETSLHVPALEESRYTAYTEGGIGLT